MTMAERVHADVPEVIAAARRLQAQGEALERTTKTHLQNITKAENGHEVFAPDEFTETFLRIYHKTTEVGQLNEAIKKNLEQLGPTMKEFGHYLVSGMWTTAGTDHDSGSDIAKA
jgi:hypothetical protein